MRKKLIIIISIFMTLNIFASEKYAIANINLTDKSNNIIADITKGTKVKVLKQKGNMSYVKISGWSYEEEPNLDIFPDIGITVVLTTIKEKYVKNRNIKKTQTDTYEEVWLKNSINGWVESNKLTKDFKMLWKMESTFASERCGACHSEPRASNIAAVEFPSLINSMKETAGLSDSEESFVVNYYQKNNIYKNKLNH